MQVSIKEGALSLVNHSEVLSACLAVGDSESPTSQVCCTSYFIQIAECIPRCYMQRFYTHDLHSLGTAVQGLIPQSLPSFPGSGLTTSGLSKSPSHVE